MVEAAITPFSEHYQDCILWLNWFFKTFGDKMPNFDEIRLSLMGKTEVYEHYKKDSISDRGEHYQLVSYSMFVSLWNICFPHCVIRPFCDIPGKCDICFEIDKMRQATDTTIVQEHLRQAHLLHRGGMFMLERKR